jgi:nucleotide-binding universal stress UspA family protein
MMTLTKILVPIALSPSCAWAAQYGAQLARRFGSELLFIHVANCRRETVEAFLCAELKDTPHEIVIRQGDPADAIVQFARETAPSLIVMPTHSYGRFRLFLLGSITAKVLHDVDYPVLTGVHQESVPRPAQADFDQIVCAVDTDQAFAPVIRGALEFSSLLNGTLTVVHAVPAADETSDNPGEKELRKYLFRAAEENFARLQREAEVDVRISLAGGAVSTVVREAALRLHAKLVIIGRGHTQRSLGRLRTHSYGIIRNSPCPVLSI